MYEVVWGWAAAVGEHILKEPPVKLTSCYLSVHMLAVKWEGPMGKQSRIQGLRCKGSH
jgi:hypothetical protein